MDEELPYEVVEIPDEDDTEVWARWRWSRPIRTEKGGV